MAARRMLPLRGIKVLELEGLAAAPFAGLVLADFGADVVRVDRRGRDADPYGTTSLGGGKRSVALDLKAPADAATLREMAGCADVLIEPYRPGVMERLGLGPEDLMGDHNPGLVYARLTGWGQAGARSSEVGHDINYIGLTGLLSTFARTGERPLPPVNLLGDFAGGGLSCALGVTLALMERAVSGKGQVVDAAMVDGAMYTGSFLYSLAAQGMWSPRPGTNMLDTGAHFYDCYECADGKHVAVGAIEAPFYDALIDGLCEHGGLLESASSSSSSSSSELLPAQHDQSQWPAMRARFAECFKKRPRDEWASSGGGSSSSSSSSSVSGGGGGVFDGTDACVTPVLTFEEAAADPHISARQQMATKSTANTDSTNNTGTPRLPLPAPRLSVTPGQRAAAADASNSSLDAEELLAEWQQ